MECSDQKTKIHESVDARAPVAQECHEHKLPVASGVVRETE